MDLIKRSEDSDSGGVNDTRNKQLEEVPKEIYDPFRV